jgi:hypothetical protein
LSGSAGSGALFEAGDLGRIFEYNIVVQLSNFRRDVWIAVGAQLSQWGKLISLGLQLQ